MPIPLAAPAAAHGGGLAADGCHNDRKRGGRHCHRGSKDAAPRAPAPARLMGQDAYFANCTEARRAGAAPLRRGDPGYRSRLDRDNDGVACE
ncbi:excalibur calcium-binding domain-containing protein [Pacificimonas sp. WHA3]|uniref:Excalibur calcium-binding domain-containing protein n=2 Tax=Pacificimonas pallii TaxID=2827236 RepID=A0ABS6SEA8_9SPHN|nr:excalibur calcium-binding domain-containing protein [Pacificimonas pallii]